MSRILLVDDEQVMRSFLEKALARGGHEVTSAASAEEARDAFAPRRFDMVLTDLKMPGDSGLDLLTDLRQRDPSTPVVIMTAFGSIQTAVEAVKQGAADFLTKPLELSHLQLVVERTLASRKAQAEIERLRPLADDRDRMGEMIGGSLPMKKVYNLIDKVARSDLTVLITGETGTGKELCARAIHEQSPRAGKVFQVVNCAGFQETLLESELFGHEKGSFTGADRRRIGHFEAASGGTLFLDEVGEATPAVQAKLLRAIQEKEITRVGGTQPIKVDVRIVTATNRDLQAEVEAGTFRQDLYYRLATFPVHMPPLRERLDDLPALIEHFLADHPQSNVTPEASLALVSYGWPGNVRQLKHAMARASVLSEGAEIRLEHLPELPGGEPTREQAVASLSAAGEAFFGLPLKEARAQFEKVYLERLLQQCGGNVSETARQAGLGRASLHEKINKLGLDPDRYR
jgi:DNA-binding NtrC family response regulator